MTSRAPRRCTSTSARKHWLHTASPSAAAPCRPETELFQTAAWWWSDHWAVYAVSLLPSSSRWFGIHTQGLNGRVASPPLSRDSTGQRYRYFPCTIGWRSLRTSILLFRPLLLLLLRISGGPGQSLSKPKEKPSRRTAGAWATCMVRWMKTACLR